MKTAWIQFALSQYIVKQHSEGMQKVCMKGIITCPSYNLCSAFYWVLSSFFLLRVYKLLLVTFLWKFYISLLKEEEEKRMGEKLKALNYPT